MVGFELLVFGIILQVQIHKLIKTKLFHQTVRLLLRCLQTLVQRQLGLTYVLICFYNCKGVGFNVGANFGFTSEWDNVTVVGAYFLRYMFYGCSMLTTLPSDFNIPQSIMTVGNNFCHCMFYGCSSLITLPNNFNLPPNIITVGDAFCRLMFHNCTSLGVLPAYFSIPQGITSVGASFCGEMFQGCDHDSFMVNAAFMFPLLMQSELDKTDVFYRTFRCATNKTYPLQNTLALIILNGNPTPSSNRQTFSTYNATQGANRWSDYNSLAAEWK